MVDAPRLIVDGRRRAARASFCALPGDQRDRSRSSIDADQTPLIGAVVPVEPVVVDAASHAAPSIVSAVQATE